MSTHSELVGQELHDAYHYVQETDPGAVGANLYWLQVSTGIVKRRKSDNSDWNFVSPNSGITDPTTTKGDLIVRGSSTIGRLPAGVDGQVLIADASQTLGIKWAASPGGGGGSATLTFSSVGDTNGIVYFRGTNNKTYFTFVNPDGKLTLAVGSARTSNAASALTSRTGTDGYANDAVGSYVGLDLGVGAGLTVNHYALQNRTTGSPAAYPKNWKLQGSNNVATDDDTGFTGATWADLDTQTNNTAMSTSAAWFNGAVSSSTAYRWLRILTNGVDSAGTHFLTIAQFEFYGALTF